VGHRTTAVATFVELLDTIIVDEQEATVAEMIAALAVAQHALIVGAYEDDDDEDEDEVCEDEDDEAESPACGLMAA
jgi:CO dehydrogenase/acetyl-CoA synthase beta subunit